MENPLLRQPADEALFKSELAYRTLVETSHDLIWSVDAQGRWTFVNAAARTIYGYEPVELLGRPFMDFQTPEQAQKDLAVFARIKAGTPFFNYETEHRRKDGKPVWLSFNAVVQRDEQGRVVGTSGTARDISERKEAEAEAQRRLDLEAQLTRLASAAPGAIYSFRLRPDGSSHFPFAGAKFSEMFGLEPAQLMKDSAPAFAMIHPEDLAQVQASILNSAASLLPWQAEFRVLIPGRNVVWLEGKSTPQREFDGATLWHGFLLEIEERKRAEAFANGQRRVLEMVASEATLADTLDTLLRVVEVQMKSALTSILLLDDDGERLRHASAPSLPAEYSKAIDGIRIGPGVGACGSAASSRKPVFTENIGTDAFWVNYAPLALKHGLQACWSTPLFDGRGGLLGTFAVYYGQPGLPTAEHVRVIEQVSHLAAICILKTRTLNRLRRSEERFRSLIENGSDLISVVNDAGVIRYQSPSVRHLLGYEPDEMIGRNTFEFIHSEDAPQVQEAMKRALTLPAVQTPVEYRLRHHDGTWRIFQSIGRSVPGEAADGFLIVNSRDISERRALEEQLRQAQKMDAMGTLAGGIAHDFNNILTAILGNVELARWDVHSPTEVEVGLSEINKAAVRAKDLVRQILTFSRQQVQQRSVIPLGPVVEECAGMLRATLPRSVEFNIALLSDVPPVRADGTQIHQILLNLCTNAWQALPGSQGRIDIRLESGEPPASVRRRLPALSAGPCVLLSVRDNGTGMTAATIERIFEPFFTTKEPGKGTGLGLSVVHGIVLAHDGAIEVESAPGQGTSFLLYFPAAKYDEAGAESMPQQPAMGNGQRVFYVDDEESLVRVGCRMLERLGFAAVGFTRPDEALADFRAASDQVEAVVTDFNMPGKSGLALAAEMLALRPGLWVVLSSGYISEDLRQQALAVGINEIIHKPNTFEQLAQALRAVPGVK